MVRRINLVPPSERSRTTTDLGLLGLIAAAIVVIFAIAFGYYLLNNTLSDREQELAGLQQETASLETQLLALRQYEDLQSQRADMEAVAQGIYESRTPVSDILDAVSLVVPENAWFQSLALTTSDPAVSESAAGAGQTTVVAPNDNKISVEGNTYSFEDIAQVLVRLQLVSCLSDVSLASAGEPRGTTDPAQKVKGFSIEATVDAPPTALPLPMSQVEVEGL